MSVLSVKRGVRCAKAAKVYLSVCISSNSETDCIETTLNLFGT